MFEKIFSHLNSIRYKYLLSSVVLMVIFSILVISFWYRNTTSDAEKSAVTYISEVLRVCNENFEVALKDVNSILSAIANNNAELNYILKKGEYTSEAEIHSDNIKVEDFLNKISTYKYYLNGIFVFDLKDKYYKTGIFMPLNDLKLQPWYSEIVDLNADRLFIPPHLYDIWLTHTPEYGYKNMVLSFAKPIKDGDKKIGTAIADIRCEILYNIFNRELVNKGTVYIVDEKLENFIFLPDSADKLSQTDSVELLKMMRDIKNQEGNFYIDINGQNMLVAYYRSSFTGWTTLGLIPKDRLLSNFYNARNFVTMLTIVFCILSVAVLTVISSLITKNMLRLSRAVNLIDRDNFELNVEIKSKDEVNQLYRQIKKMLFRIKELIEDIKKTEKEKRKAETRALQSQINPHFLYNTLNTIKFLSTLHGIESIKKVSESLSLLMHVNMDARLFISVGEEVQYIKSYLEIQEFKYGNKMAYNIIAEDGVENYMTLKLLLQPLIENSLIHGISGVEGKGVVNIKIYLDDSKLKLRVQDNGSGIDSNTISKILNGNIQSGSIGLYNTISRIKLYFGEPYGLEILSQPGIFTVIEITVPLVTEDEVKNYV